MVPVVVKALSTDCQQIVALNEYLMVGVPIVQDEASA
jgi:hypothetical protein